MDYISREAAKHAVVAWARVIAESDLLVRDDALIALDCIPAADVREVKRAEWKNNKDDYPECSVCGYMPMYDPNMDDIYYSPFCPNCGAMMGGQDNG